MNLVIRLYDANLRDVITPAIYSYPIQIITGGPGLTLLPQQMSEDELRSVFFNLRLVSIGVVAIVLDEALAEVFGPRDPNEATPMGSARAIIRLIRNAYAHEITNPRWDIRPPYNRLYGVVSDTGRLIVLDAEILDGEPLRFNHFGGLEAFVDLINFCVQRVPRP